MCIRVVEISIPGVVLYHSDMSEEFNSESGIRIYFICHKVVSKCQKYFQNTKFPIWKSTFTSEILNRRIVNIELKCR